MENIQLIDIYKVGNKIISSDIQGSGEYVHANVFEIEKYDELKKRILEKDWEWTFKNNIKFENKDVLKSLPEGSLLIGNYDLDKAIEITTCAGKFWEKNNMSLPMEINENGIISMESGTIPYLTLHLATIMSNIYFILIVVLLFPLCLITWIVYFIHRYMT